MTVTLNVAQQARVERSLRSALLAAVAKHARDGLPAERIVEAVSAVLDIEKRLLASQRADERSY